MFAVWLVVVRMRMFGMIHEWTLEDNSDDKNK